MPGGHCIPCGIAALFARLPHLKQRSQVEAVASCHWTTPPCVEVGTGFEPVLDVRWTVAVDAADERRTLRPAESGRIISVCGGSRLPLPIGLPAHEMVSRKGFEPLLERWPDQSQPYEESVTHG